MSENKSKKGIKLLVVGSTRFQKIGFTHAVLDMFERVLNFESIYCGHTPGTDQFVRSWAKEKKISCLDFSIPNHDQMEINFFDPQRKIPESLLLNDPLFQTGYKKIQSIAPHAVLLLPNQAGELGATADCVARMAHLLNICPYNGKVLLDKMLQNTNQYIAQNHLSANAEQSSTPANKQNQPTFSRQQNKHLKL